MCINRARVQRCLNRPENSVESLVAKSHTAVSPLMRALGTEHGSSAIVYAPYRRATSRQQPSYFCLSDRAIFLIFDLLYTAQFFNTEQSWGILGATPSEQMNVLSMKRQEHL